jgi:hypothetical protein
VTDAFVRIERHETGVAVVTLDRPLINPLIHPLLNPLPRPRA